jgi:hypothetical protein
MEGRHLVQRWGRFGQRSGSLWRRQWWTWRDHGQRHARVGCGIRDGGGGRRRCVCPGPDEPLAALLACQLAEAQLVPHGVQACLVHAEDILEGAIGDPLLTLEQRHHRQEHGVELPLGLGRRAGVGLRSGRCSRPDEAFIIRLHHPWLPIEEFVF